MNILGANFITNLFIIQLLSRCLAVYIWIFRCCLILYLILTKFDKIGNMDTKRRRLLHHISIHDWWITYTDLVRAVWEGSCSNSIFHLRRTNKKVKENIYFTAISFWHKNGHTGAIRSPQALAILSTIEEISKTTNKIDLKLISVFMLESMVRSLLRSLFILLLCFEIETMKRTSFCHVFIPTRLFSDKKKKKM